jgi:hypothetical protein
MTARTTDLHAQWRQDNCDAIDSINAFIERCNLLASRLRYRPELHQKYPMLRPKAATSSQIASDATAE